MKTTKKTTLSRIERAIILLAGYLEDPNHDAYQVRNHVLDILGYKKLNSKK